MFLNWYYSDEFELRNISNTSFPAYCDTNFGTGLSVRLIKGVSSIRSHCNRKQKILCSVKFSREFNFADCRVLRSVWRERIFTNLDFRLYRWEQIFADLGHVPVRYNHNSSTELYITVQREEHISIHSHVLYCMRRTPPQSIV